MIYLHEATEDELAETVEMCVLEVDIDDQPGRAINIFLPTRDTDADPAVCQLAITEDGTVISDTPFDAAADAQMIEDQILDAQERIAFCQEALASLDAASA